MPNQYLPPVIAIPSSLLITNITQSLPMVISVSIGNPSTEANTYIVEGKPGTGKTILATYLLKYLKDKEETKKDEKAFVDGLVKEQSSTYAIQKLYRKPLPVSVYRHTSLVEALEAKAVELEEAFKQLDGADKIEAQIDVRLGDAPAGSLPLADSSETPLTGRQKAWLAATSI